MENIILYVSDQWRSDSLKLNGNGACYTPNLDSIASDGVNFSNAFCQNPVCVPSRCSFLSGLYPHTNGHRAMHFLMREYEQNILRTMKNNGYDVLWCGRNHFLHDDVDKMKYCTKHVEPYSDFFTSLKNRESDNEEYQELYNIVEELENKYREKDNYYYAHMYGITEKAILGLMDKGVVDEAIKYMDEYDKTKPFFMYLTGMLPHPPYEVEPEFLKHIDISEIDKPIRLTAEQLENKASIIKGIRNNQEIYNLTDEELIEIKAIYYAMGTKLDSYIGKLVEGLKERNLYDTTTIIFSSDHGDFTGDYEIVEKNQNTFEDMLTNVPLIIKPSKSIDTKVRSTDALVELIDIQATILDIANIDPGYTHFGKSLLNTIAGNDEHRKTVHCEGGRLEYEGAYAMDAGHTTENPYWARTTEQEKMPQHTKAIMTRTQDYKYVFRLYEKDELYDLINDKHETTNLIDKINKDQVLKVIHDDLKQKFVEFMVETSDIIPHERDNS